MDPAALSALATTVSSGLIEAMMADTWDTIRTRAAKIISRGSAAKEREAIRDLEASRLSIQRAADVADSLLLRQAVGAEWSGKLRTLMEANPALADEFNGLLALIQQASPRSMVTQHVTARRDAYTAGGDQHISISKPKDER
jgi:hypothetical protein